ncbi:MAG: ATP-dependent protease ATPase subunit HslU [Armatimonadetes bacterium]|nr:ATP-dependent protease ATPase subunit HslU [Armatimonadota bacterium]
MSSNSRSEIQRVAEKGGNTALIDELTPKEIVQELDKYIVGQEEAKRAVAIALRNRARRKLVPEHLRDEIVPKNILMIGPTGVGKTEIARRLARLANAPFVKVEATKFTEVGYVGRDVDSMIRDLVDVAYNMVRQEATNAVWNQAEQRAEERLLDALLGPSPEPAQPLGSIFGVPPQPAPRQQHEDERRQYIQRREELRAALRAGRLDDREVEIEVEEPAVQSLQVFSSAGLEEMGINMQDILGSLFPGRRTTRRVKVAEARRILAEQEADRLVDHQQIAREAVRRTEESGIVFIDELDKIAGRETHTVGPDVSREGVQRDILPIIEGSTVITKHGPVRTDHILFIAAGAFHTASPSDLIPELQGRLPIRVRLHSLNEEHFRRILVEPENSLVRQYTALMATEGVELEFTEDAIAEIARLAQYVNEQEENIGARRLYTIMERVLEEISFNAPDLAGQKVVIDAAYVRQRLADLIKDRDLSRHML